MKTKKTILNVNCYSDGEGGFMKWGQDFRAKLLGPLLISLAAARMRASHVTLGSLLFGLAFCPLYLAGFPVWAFAALTLHVLLDGLDGPLARHAGTASSRGSFTDTMADQVVVTATIIAMIQAGSASIWAGGLYAFFYTMVVVFAMVRNALQEPYSWLFRPRFLIFIWFVVESFWLQNTLNLVLWPAVALLAIKTLTGFLSIRRKI